MTFLVVLSAWALLQWRGPSTALHRDHWLHYWYLRATPALRALPQPWRLLVILIAPPLLAAFLMEALDDALAGLLAFGFALLVFAYSLGRGDFGATLDAYLAPWRRGDSEAAYQRAVGLGLIGPAQRIETLADLHEKARAGALYRGYSRWFGVVFWFVLLGPAGALGYRVLHLVQDERHATAEERQWLARWLAWLDWLPARLLAATFAVTGDFSRVMGVWSASWGQRVPASELLARCQRAAFIGPLVPHAPGFTADAADELQQARALLGRSAVAWLVLLALVQLI